MGLSSVKMTADVRERGIEVFEGFAALVEHGTEFFRSGGEVLGGLAELGEDPSDVGDIFVGEHARVEFIDGDIRVAPDFLEFVHGGGDAGDPSLHVGEGVGGLFRKGLDLVLEGSEGTGADPVEGVALLEKVDLRAVRALGHLHADEFVAEQTGSRDRDFRVARDPDALVDFQGDDHAVESLVQHRQGSDASDPGPPETDVRTRQHARGIAETRVRACSSRSCGARISHIERMSTPRMTNPTKRKRPTRVAVLSLGVPWREG
jgi:hypothetical protein